MQSAIRLAAILVFLQCTDSCLAQAVRTKEHRQSEIQQEVLFFDDFSDDEIDRSKWNVRIMGKPHNREQQAYVDSADTLFIAHDNRAKGATDGALVLQARFTPNFDTNEERIADFTSTRINSRGKFDFTYGTAAARIKLCDGPGVWPAFWLLGNGKWPETGEIDIMEYVGETDWIGVALHGPGYSGNTPFVNKAFFREGTDATQWHIYSVDWARDKIEFRVDGNIIYRVTRPMVERHGEWSYDTPKFLILNLALGGAYPLKNNCVESPYLGIPKSTVELIKNDHAKMLVDWVKVTRDTPK